MEAVTLGWHRVIVWPLLGCVLAYQRDAEKEILLGWQETTPKRGGNDSEADTALHRERMRTNVTCLLTELRLQSNRSQIRAGNEQHQVKLQQSHRWLRH